MDKILLFRANLGDYDSPPHISLAGEVIFESAASSAQKFIKKHIHHSLLRACLLAAGSHGDFTWATYLVIFSPGQEENEVRCQIEIDTNGARAAFEIGYGQQLIHAFNDALERIVWSEKNMPLPMIM